MGKWGNVKQKPFRQIWAYSRMFWHIPAYSDISRCNQANLGIFRNYSDTFWTLWNPGIFRTLVSSESWHILNQRHIQNPGISKTLAHSEPETYSEYWAIKNPRIFRTGGILRILPNIYDGVLWEIANGYNYFRKW